MSVTPSPAARALMANCPLGACWALPGFPCDPRGLHLARYQRAFRRGILPRDELAAVVESLAVISGQAIVPGVPAGEAAA